MSCLDLSFTSPSVFTDFKWDVLNNPYGSDHLPVIISPSSSPEIIPSRPRRWKLHLANWALFREEACLEKVYSENLSVDELDEVFTSCIITAAHLSIPQSTGNMRHKHKVWYTRECRDAKKKQNKAWGIFRRYSTHENLINFKKTRAEARHIRRNAEKASWQKYISSINSSMTSKKMWEQVRKLDGSFLPYTVPLLTAPGTQTSIKEQADLLGEHFATVSSSSHYTQSFTKHKNTAEKQTSNNWKYPRTIQ